MNKTIISFCLVLFSGFYLCVNAQSPWVWASRGGVSSKPGGGSKGSAGAVQVTDDVGNCYVTGGFSGQITLGGSTIVTGPSGVANISAGAFFLTKYSPTGNNEWAVNATAGFGNSSGGSFITLSKNEYLYVVGKFNNNIYIGNDTLVGTSGYGDIFIAKYDLNGQFIWAHQIGSGNFNSELSDIVSTSDGGFLLTGYIQSGTATFGSTTINVVGNQVISFILRFDSIGNLTWTWSSTTGSVVTTSIAIDIMGNIYCSGFSTGTINLGNNVFEKNGSFIIKLNATGSVLWAKQLTTGNLSWGSDDGVTDIELDANSNLYTVGKFYDYINFPGGIVTTGLSGENFFLAKWSDEGQLLWVENPSSSNASYSQGHAIRLDDNDNVYIAGKFSGGTVNFDSNILHSNSTGGAGFIAKYNSSGENLWVVKAEGTSNFNIQQLTLDSSNNCYLSGSHMGSATFGSHTVYLNDAFDDYFLAKLETATLNTAVGLDNEYKISINIYPNPTTGLVFLELPEEKTFSLKVFDTSGRLILSDPIINETYALDIILFPKGLYYILLENDNHLISRTIVKE